MSELKRYVKERIEKIYRDLELDKKIGADTYDNIGRLNEVLAIEKILTKEGLK